MNKLLKAEHPEYGIWYFTNTNQCANVIGIGRTTLDYHIERSGKYNEWEFKWVDGSDVLYKFVNPSKEEVEREKYWIMKFNPKYNLRYTK